jgi:NAD(P)-dependent dehydrogenase (short-subunit alcohol dehydrogenase family)
MCGPEDVVEGVVYLVSDRSEDVTGTVLDMNGGLFVR